MRASDTGTIYGLVDPRNGEVKYIGQTGRPIEVRLAGHMAAPAPRVRAWIEALAVEGRSPEIIPIHEDVPAAELDAVEGETIRAYAGSGGLLNTVGNEPGNAIRRKTSREEAKRRRAEEEAMKETWRQATWRQVADQIRAATGGPISPADIPIREIPTPVWEAYLAYRQADRELKETLAGGYLLHPDWGNLFRSDRATAKEETPEERERRALRLQRSNAQAGLEHYLRAYRGAFSAVDRGDRRGSEDRVFGRGVEAYEGEFRDSSHMARHLSLIPWAARALDPWVALAKASGMDVNGDEFRDWVSDDEETRSAIDLYRLAAPGWLGVFRQSWDSAIDTYMLALGAAHVPGFTVPDPLRSVLQERLTEVARDRQATRKMCELLQSMNPKALDVVYGRDKLAESDEALRLPPGTSMLVIRQVYGGDSLDPDDQAAKLIQRHAGTFDAVSLPGYFDWSGPHVPAMRVTVACFARAGLFPGAQKAEVDKLLTDVKATWMPTVHGLEDLEEMDERLRRRATRSHVSPA